MTDTRQNFSDGTRRLIAQRAAYRCSVPNCDRLTIGPGLRDDEVENTGVAAHIYSAADRGPRGQGGLSNDELRSASNGLWTCGAHSSLIDKNKGVRYAASTLLSWKALHEFRIAQEHSGRTITFGAVRRMRITESPLFMPDTTIEFAKTTFIVGANDTGKTAVCEWLSSVDSPRHLGRWRALLSPLKYTIEFDAPSNRTLHVEIGDEVPALTLDDSAVAFNQIPIATTLLGYQSGDTYVDNLDRFEKALFLDPVSVKSLASFIAEDSIFLRSAVFVTELDDDGLARQTLRCVLKDGATRTFNALSTSEKGRVLLDFAMAGARNASLFRPALLMIEFNGLGLSWETFQDYLDALAAPSANFQTIVTTHTLPDEVAKLGWQIYRIRREAAGRREIFQY